MLRGYCVLAAVIGSIARRQVEPFVWLQLFVATSIRTGTKAVGEALRG